MADRIPSELETEVRRRFSELFEKNKTVEGIYKKIKQGIATYDDASLFSQEVGGILADVFKGIDLSKVDLNDLAYNVVWNAANQNISLSNLVCESVQSALNESAGIGLNPVIPKLDARKIEGISDLVYNSTDEEALKVVLNEPLITNVMQNVDDWVQTNADFQYESGLKPIIVRTWSGSRPSHDTKHTDWCESLAGTYDYSSRMDKDVFKRHEGCRCKIEYFPNKKAKGRIAALSKGEKDVNQSLYNTGKYTSTRRKSVLEQRRKIYGREEARKILNAEWKDGFNGNAERHF